MEERTLAEVKRATRFTAGKLPHRCFLLSRGHSLEIELCKWYMPFRNDNLDRLAIHCGEGRPQHLVAAYNLIQAMDKSGHVESSGEAYTGDKHIGCASWS
jgi:hypothetical protein